MESWETTRIIFYRRLRTSTTIISVLLRNRDELQAYSKGLMHIEVVDPTNSEDEQARAARFGVQSVPYRFTSKNLIMTQASFMGLVLIYGDQQKVPILNTLFLEYDLAVALERLRKEDKRILAISSGHQEPDILNGQGPLATMLSKLRTFVVVDSP